MHKYHLWAMGGVGPFGRVFLSSDELDQHLTISHHMPNAVFPLLNSPPNTFPTQTDFYNCGVLVILTILDMVLTQWDKKWATCDMEHWSSQINQKSVYFLIPKEYGLGTSFVSLPEQATGTDYTQICDIIRVEFLVLLERLYVIYHQAFSSKDEEVDSRQWGTIPKRYLSMMEVYKEKEHVIKKMFKEIAWPTYKDLQPLEIRTQLFTDFVQQGQPVFPAFSISITDFVQLTDSISDLSLWKKDRTKRG